MNRRTRTALTAASAAALTGGLFTAAAPAAVAADAAVVARADFNGDGAGDVVSSARATVNGHPKAGQVVVTYGVKSKGLTADRRSVISQATPGVAGTPEEADWFGWRNAYADFDGDGYDDLAVGAHREDVGDVQDAGSVTVLWGSAGGLTGQGSVQIENPAGDFRSARWGDRLAAGDFDGDGRQDLAVIGLSTTVTLIKGGITRSGSYGDAQQVPTPLTDRISQALTAGDVDGDGATDLLVGGFAEEGMESIRVPRNFLLRGSPSGLDPAGVTEMPPGSHSSIGDIDRDGLADVVSGMTYDRWTDRPGLPYSSLGGRIWITYGTEDGTGRVRSVDQDTAGVPGVGETGDGFGFSTDLGDIDGDGYLDLAVGVVSEVVGATRTGAVVILHGSASGITTGGAQTLHQATSGVPGTAEDGDGFGGDVKLDDVTGDGRADLVVASPGENDGNGGITFLPAGGGRITATGSRVLSPTALGVPTAGKPMLGEDLAR
ncbi:VCBS repeat-containing protein [Streptomyces sp. NPDC056600]|uniref:VCBS repeat-containing protein n=1 Tax=Streptomyces sp. NPDC056600 TaxID=3345874 RepID=UPI0036CB181B